MRARVRLVPIAVFGLAVAVAPTAGAAECPHVQVTLKFDKPAGRQAKVGPGAPVEFKGIVVAPGGCTLPNLGANLTFKRKSPAPEQALVSRHAGREWQVQTQKVLSPGGTYQVSAQFFRKQEGTPGYGLPTEITFTVRVLTPLPGGTPPVKP